MRKLDWADKQAETLYDGVRDALKDEVVIDAIADRLRDAKRAGALAALDEHDRLCTSIIGGVHHARDVLRRRIEAGEWEKL